MPHLLNRARDSAACLLWARAVTVLVGCAAGIVALGPIHASAQQLYWLIMVPYVRLLPFTGFFRTPAMARGMPEALARCSYADIVLTAVWAVLASVTFFIDANADTPLYVLLSASMLLPLATYPLMGQSIWRTLVGGVPGAADRRPA